MIELDKAVPGKLYVMDRDINLNNKLIIAKCVPFLLISVEHGTGMFGERIVICHVLANGNLSRFRYTKRIKLTVEPC